MKVGDLVKYADHAMNGSPPRQRGIILECLMDDYWGPTAMVWFEDGHTCEVEHGDLELISESR